MEEKLDILCTLVKSKMELIPALADQIKVLRNNQDTLLRELLETRCDLSKAYDTIEDLKDTIARESFEKDREGKNVVIWNLSIKELAKHRSRASTDKESVGSFAGLLVRRVLPDIGGISGGLCSGCTLLSLYIFIGMPLTSIPFLNGIYIVFFIPLYEK